MKRQNVISKRRLLVLRNVLRLVSIYLIYHNDKKKHLGQVPFSRTSRVPQFRSLHHVLYHVTRHRFRTALCIKGMLVFAFLVIWLRDMAAGYDLTFEWGTADAKIPVVVTSDHVNYALWTPQYALWQRQFAIKPWIRITADGEQIEWYTIGTIEDVWKYDFIICIVCTTVKIVS